MNIVDFEPERARAVPPHADPESATADEGVRGTTGPLTPAQVLHLQQTAGNAAVGRALARQRTLQRLVTVGEDPLNDLSRPDAKGLIYGMSPARKATSKRMDAHDNLQSDDTPRRTIDEYNLDAGINSAMRSAAVGIFAIREALQERDPVAVWTRHFTESKDPTADDDLAAWITFLASRRDHVGLLDLSVSGKVGAKHRFTKNLKHQEHARTTGLDEGRISGWLAPTRSAADAGRDVALQFSRDEIQDLDKWIFSAFFRRTSKLGIDFTLGRGHTIHMNIAANPDFDPNHPDAALQERGLADLQARDREQSHGRSISSQRVPARTEVAGPGPRQGQFLQRDPGPARERRPPGCARPDPPCSKEEEVVQAVDVVRVTRLSRARGGAGLGARRCR